MADTDRRLSGAVTVLTGVDNGRYPHGNSMLVAGSSGTVLIDPSLSVHQRGGAPVSVDRVLVSHAHEDHLAGLSLFPQASVHAHDDDLLGITSMGGFMTVYGMKPELATEWSRTVVEEFFYEPRPDAIGFGDGDVFHLGSGRTVTAIHLSGHTRGHCGFLVEPDGAMFVGDIDLTAFGPYYGDHWSDLESFERAMARAREIDARFYITFHQKGVVEGRAMFVEMLDAYASVITRRERALVEFLTEPRSMADIVARRFVYRPGAAAMFIDHVEERSAALHLERLLARGDVTAPEPGLFRAG